MELGSAISVHLRLPEGSGRTEVPLPSRFSRTFSKAGILEHQLVKRGARPKLFIFAGLELGPTGRPDVQGGFVKPGPIGRGGVVTQ